MTSESFKVLLQAASNFPLDPDMVAEARTR